MDKLFKSFHYISFLQYPFMLMALYYCYEPIIKGIENFNKDAIIENYNLCLLFFGIALSFTSLADIRKRTKLGDKIFGKEKRAKNWLIYVCMLVIIIFALGIFCKFFTNDEKIQKLSIGVFVFGIGMLGLLRMNIEIIKTYQKDW
ncbi:MAG: hypothetical protein ACWA5P_07540 [bacterium]